MSARAARRLLARLAGHGVTLATVGDDGLQPSRGIPNNLRAAIKANFQTVFELVAAREDDEASALIARASALHGWTPDDELTAQEAVDRDARVALTWLRWIANRGDARSLVKDLKPDLRTGRVRRRQETTR